MVGNCGQIGTRRVARHRFCEPEVQYLDRPVVADFDVRWFEIAVDDALLMRGFERLRDLAGDRQGVTDRDRSTSDLLRQILTFNELHDQRTHATGFFEAVDMRDVRMVQGGENFRFPLEASEPLGIAGKGLGECLDSDIAFKARVASLVDLTHAAGTDSRQNLVRADTSAGEETHVREVAHYMATNRSDSGPSVRSARAQLLRGILPRSRHLPLASTEGSLTRNLNKTGVRLWTDRGAAYRVSHVAPLPCSSLRRHEALQLFKWPLVS